jgi:hypothetical protein
MLAGHLALIIAAVFTGATIYLNIVEQRPTAAPGSAIIEKLLPFQGAA